MKARKRAKERYEMALSAAMDHARKVKPRATPESEFRAYAGGFRDGWAAALKKASSAAKVGPLMLATAVALGACGANPAGPSRVAKIDPRLQPAIERLRSLDVAPWSGQPMGAWIDGWRARISIGPLSDDYYAFADGGDVTINAKHFADLPVDDLAAIIVHEIRHTEGAGHTCGYFRDTAGDNGPWRAHILTTDALGHPREAIDLARTQICTNGPRSAVTGEQATPRIAVY